MAGLPCQGGSRVGRLSEPEFFLYDDDVYLDILQRKGVKKSILYMWNVDYSQYGTSKEK
jgi:hypothetical protein